MNFSITLTGAIVFFFAFAQAEGLAQEKYVLKADEELYGTWTNTVDSIPQKRIVTAAGVKEY